MTSSTWKLMAAIHIFPNTHISRGKDNRTVKFGHLLLIWMGFLGVRFEVGWGLKLPPPLCLKPGKKLQV